MPRTRPVEIGEISSGAVISKEAYTGYKLGPTTTNVKWCKVGNPTYSKDRVAHLKYIYSYCCLSLDRDDFFNLGDLCFQYPFYAIFNRHLRHRTACVVDPDAYADNGSLFSLWLPHDSYVPLNNYALCVE